MGSMPSRSPRNAIRQRVVAGTRGHARIHSRESTNTQVHAHARERHAHTEPAEFRQNRRIEGQHVPARGAAIGGGTSALTDGFGLSRRRLRAREPAQQIPEEAAGRWVAVGDARMQARPGSYNRLHGMHHTAYNNSVRAGAAYHWRPRFPHCRGGSVHHELDKRASLHAVRVCVAVSPVVRCMTRGARCMLFRRSGAEQRILRSGVLVSDGDDGRAAFLQVKMARCEQQDHLHLYWMGRISARDTRAKGRTAHRTSPSVPGADCARKMLITTPRFTRFFTCSDKTHFPGGSGVSTMPGIGVPCRVRARRGEGSFCRLPVRDRITHLANYGIIGALVLVNLVLWHWRGVLRTSKNWTENHSLRPSRCKLLPPHIRLPQSSSPLSGLLTRESGLVFSLRRIE
jgi:hypothetical protein